MLWLHWSYVGEVHQRCIQSKNMFSAQSVNVNVFSRGVLHICQTGRRAFAHKHICQIEGGRCAFASQLNSVSSPAMSECKFHTPLNCLIPPQSLGLNCSTKIAAIQIVEASCSPARSEMGKRVHWGRFLLQTFHHTPFAARFYFCKSLFKSFPFLREF